MLADLLQGAHGSAKGLAQANQVGDFPGSPCDMAEQLQYPHVTARIERAGNRAGKIHHGGIGNGANRQERQVVGTCPAGNGPTFHVDGHRPGLLVQRCLLGSGADHAAAFPDGSRLSLQLRVQVRSKPLAPGGVCGVKLIILAVDVFREDQMSGNKVFGDGCGAAPTD